MPRVLDKQRSVASIPEISFISVVENGQKFAYGKRSTQLYFFPGFTKEHYHYHYFTKGCPIHPHRNGPYKPCVDPYGSNRSSTGVYGL